MSTAEKRQEIRLEVESINELNKRITSECYEKCVSKPRDGDLSVGEMTCIDRCVPKYLETHELVGRSLTAIRAGQIPE